MSGIPRSVPNPGEAPKPDGRGKSKVEITRTARFCAETAAAAHEYKSPREWLEALDEVLNDLCHAHRLEMPCSLLDVWGKTA